VTTKKSEEKGHRNGRLRPLLGQELFLRSRYTNSGLNLRHSRIKPTKHIRDCPPECGVLPMVILTQSEPKRTKTPLTKHISCLEKSQSLHKQSRTYRLDSKAKLSCVVNKSPLYINAVEALHVVCAHVIFASKTLLSKHCLGCLLPQRGCR